MRNFKKFAAAIAATLMAASMVAPMAMSSFAAEEGQNTITVKDAESRTFVAYQLMTAKISADNKNFEYTVNPTYASYLKTALKLEETATDKNIIDAISALDDEAMRTFADTVYGLIKKMDADVSEFEGTADVDYGYYLVVDTTKGLEDDVRSKVMVNTADRTSGGVEIELKKDKPTFEKQIWDTNDTDVEMPDLEADDPLKGLEGWQKSADHDMGDAVPFKLTATLPSDINLYDDYSVAFHDTLDASVWSFNADSVKVYMNGKDVTSEFELLETPVTGDTFTLVDKNDNIKGNKDSDGNVVALSGGDTIDVYYTAILTTDAVIGNPGNWNKANLEYTNDYYWNSDGTYNPNDEDNKSKTPDKWVVAFTYQTVVDKIDGEYNDLNGATFALYKKDSEGNWNQVGDEIVGTSSSTFEFKGIDDGEYKIVEVDAPEGYSKAADIEFKVTATHTQTVETRVNDGVLTELTVDNTKLTASLNNATIQRQNEDATHNAVSGEIYTEVINQSGTKLPSTGGMGTKLFYLGGGAMVAVAGIFLITKKRMKKEEV